MKEFYYTKLAIHRIKGDIIRYGYDVDKEVSTLLKKNIKLIQLLALMNLLV